MHCFYLLSHAHKQRLSGVLLAANSYDRTIRAYNISYYIHIKMTTINVAHKNIVKLCRSREKLYILYKENLEMMNHVIKKIEVHSTSTTDLHTFCNCLCGRAVVFYLFVYEDYTFFFFPNQ